LSGPFRVAIVAGGKSSEAEVSRASAKGLADALHLAGHSTVVLELDAELVTHLSSFNPEVVFPIAHGTFGEDGCLQGLLEIQGLPYVGSGVLASAAAHDKPVAKTLFRARDLPVPRGIVVETREAASSVAVRAEAALGNGGWVIKPARGGSAIGVICLAPKTSRAERIARLREALLADTTLLVEELKPGLEVTCAVLESDHGPKALPPTLILPKQGEFYDFKSKYAAGGSTHLCPAPLPLPIVARIQELAVQAHEAVGARDLSRADFIVQNDTESAEITLLETNTLPGMTQTSLFPEAAQAAGIAFPELCERLVVRALARGASKQERAWKMP
jgi:D-alanine-D-alanine ligase